jgi:pimeloyl-ACP methyl ester carboxylesterase
MTSARAFIHGLESSAQGTKGLFFKERFPDMIVEDFNGGFEERMNKLNNILAGKSNLILVGSSYGGMMACVFSRRMPEKIKRLILLAPALNYLPPEICRGKKIDFPVTIYHGNLDDVVPPRPVHKIARILFPNLTYHLVDDDHSLHSTFAELDWDHLLS